MPLTTELAAVKLEIEERRSEAELASVSVACREIVVGGRIHPCEDAAIGRVRRINRKDVVKLDLDILNVGGDRAPDQQSGEGGAVDHRCLRRYEVVSRLGLELTRARDTRERRDLTIRTASAEEEGIGRGREGEEQRSYE